MYWYFVVRMGVLDVVSMRVSSENGVVDVGCWLLFGGLVVVVLDGDGSSLDSDCLIVGFDVHCAVSSTPKTVVYLGVFISVSTPPRLIVYCTR